MFIAENIQAVAHEHMDYELDIKVWMLFILLPLILINYIRNLKLLAPFSTVANFITLCSFGVICYYLFWRQGISMDDRKATGRLKDFPLYFGTVLFALEAIGVVSFCFSPLSFLKTSDSDHTFGK